MSKNLETDGLKSYGIRITHPDKIYPTARVKKSELLEYYNKISSRILPHIQCRPLSIIRCPGYASKDQSKLCFYQKHYDKSFGTSIQSVIIDKKTKTQQLMIKDKKGLLSLIQFSTLEIHPWGCTANDLEYPDRIIIDLDPSPQVSWKTVVESALLLRAILKKLRLTSFVKTTGGKGLHIVIPLEKKSTTWEEAKSFSHHIASYLEEKLPDLFISTASKAKRTRKIFVDYLRNTRGATAIAPFSTRNHPSCPISVPLSWRELPYTTSANEYTIHTIFQRLSKLRADPWRGFFKLKQTLPLAFKRKIAKMELNQFL